MKDAWPVTATSTPTMFATLNTMGKDAVPVKQRLVATNDTRRGRTVVMEIGPCPRCGRKIREQGVHPRLCKHCRSEMENAQIRKRMTFQRKETNMPRSKKPTNKNYVCSKIFGGCGAKFQNSPDQCPKCDRRMPLFKGIE